MISNANKTLIYFVIIEYFLIKPYALEIYLYIN